MKIRHPFVVLIEPGDVVDGKVQWHAKVIGHELDHMTWGDGPVEALEAALHLVEDLTASGDYD